MTKTLSLFSLALTTLLVGLLSSPAWAGSMTWSGQVDDNVNIVIRGRNVEYRQLTGQGVKNTSYNFNGNLTPYFRDARLDNAFGRGEINVISTRNGQVIVRVEDPQPGASFYRFTLRWNDNNGNNGGGSSTPGIVINGNGNGNDGGGNNGNWNNGDSGSLHWQAPVDGIEDIKLTGLNATWNRVRGQGAWGVRYHLSGRLPARAVRVTVNTNQGRGSVYILAQPTWQNNYTCTIRVVDNDPGAGFYDFTASW